MFFILIAIFVIIAIVHGIIAAKKRREEMQLLAARLGLSFSPDRDRRLAVTYRFLNQLAKGVAVRIEGVWCVNA